MATPSTTQKVQIALLEQEVSNLKHEVAEMKSLVRELVDAWKAATGMLRFIRILGWAAAAVTSIYALFNSKVFH